jgi:predicted ATPase/DNA-binding SARP family transcriptional activator
MLEIRTFGGFSLWKDGEAIQDLGSRKAEAILVYVAVTGQPQPRSVMATLLWPEDSESHALTSLRVALAALRRVLTEYLDISRDAVGIKPGAEIYLDVSALKEKLMGEQVEQALEIYRGDFLAGFNLRDSLEFEDWRRLQAEYLRQLLTKGLHTTILDALDTEEYKKGLFLAQRLIALDPLDEWAYRQCMLLYVLDGQRGLSLEQYELCRATLQAELGVEPSPETKQLQQQIIQGTQPIDSRTVIPPHNLPSPQTSFIGREKELAQIASLLRDPACRLLTLVGPGGIGKTRLALQAAFKVLRSFPDGVYFISLETLSLADYMVPAIASALQFNIDLFINPELDPKYQLFNFLRNKTCLLIFDGSEHLLAGVGLMAEILTNAPRLKILVTSRQKLELAGEWLFPVMGLPILQLSPGAALEPTSALRLFYERARQANTGFQPRTVGQEEVVHLCRLVEGIPLGIELAAAWTPLLTPLEIAAEIQNNLNFLTTDARDVPEKHHSLRAVFDSSWRMLDDAQRQAFCRLAVFQGDFDHNAAQQIAGLSLAQLSSLLAKSLLTNEHSGRFHLHALLRRYADEKLEFNSSEKESIHENHCHYYIDFLLQREKDLFSAGMYIARDEIRPELDNLRAAVKWATVHWPIEQIRRLLVILSSFYVIHGWYEGKDALHEIARVRSDSLISRGISDVQSDPVYLSVRAHQAFFLCNMGQSKESDEISQECLQPLQELGFSLELSVCIQNLGVNAAFRGEYKRAIELLESAILIGKDCNFFAWPTYLLWLGHTYWLQGEYQRGMDYLEKAYELFKRQENSWGLAFALSKMGLLADGLEQFADAITFHRKAFTIFEQINSPAGKAYVLSRMCMAAYFQDNYAQAIQFGLQAYQMFDTLGHIWGLITSLSRLGFAYLGSGELEKAREYFNTSLVQSRQNDMTPQALYALAGLACVLVQEGEEGKALALFHYVKQHPQTPPVYVQQASRWFVELDQSAVMERSNLLDDQMDLDAVIDQHSY